MSGSGSTSFGTGPVAASFLGSIMPDSAFHRDVTLSELGHGAGYFLWGFRAFAFGRHQCGCLKRGYNVLFDALSNDVLNDISDLSALLGRVGGRRIKLAKPGCMHVTHDEASLLAAICAAQDGDVDLRDAHLSWLMAGDADQRVSYICERVGGLFRVIGYPINAPGQQVTHEEPSVSLSSLQVVGTA